LGGKTNYSKQLIFAGLCTLIATFILLTDSKLFTALPTCYMFGIALMLATFVLGKTSMVQKAGSR
jgi:rod shape determining protein RodA